MTKQNRAARILRLTLPPVLTIGASAFILTEAYMIHERQHNNVSLHQPGALNTISAHNYAGHQIQNETTAGHGNSTNSTSNSKGNRSSSNKSTSNTKPPANKTSKSDGESSKQSKSKSNSNPSPKTNPSGSEGFTPVTGGKLTPSPNPARLNLAQPFSSVVTQYGAFPETTFSPGDFNLYYGIKISLKFPSKMNVSKNQILAVPLQAGVLWAIIPKTNSGAASATTSLYYTQYSKTGNRVTLSPNAQLLGVIPVTTGSASKIQTSWYHPGKKQSPTSGQNQSNGTTGNNQTGNSSNGPAASMNVQPNISPQVKNKGASGNSSTSNNTANTTNTTGNTANSTGNTTSTAVKQTAYQLQNSAAGQYSAQFRTISDSGSTGVHLLLQGLYQVTGGAVIELMTQSAAETGQWAYFWNEQRQALMPICSVQNTSSQKGWVTIGEQTMYWGQRALIPPKMQYYKGKQYMLNFAAMKPYSIKLGNWTSDVMAGRDLSGSKPDGHQNEDNLYFEIGTSGNWKEFIPTEHK